MTIKTPDQKLSFKNIPALLAGPWRVNPLFLTIVFTLINSSSFVRVGISQEENLQKVILESVPIGAITAVVSFMCFWGVSAAVTKSTSLRAQQVAFHIGLLSASAILLALNLYLSGDAGKDFFVFTAVRIYLGALALSIFAGLSERKLLAQIQRAELALVEVDKQKSLILESEENVRREVANFLHDQVQAGLVVASIELQRIAQDTSGKSATELTSVIAELEEIRRFDVRDASRLLSPDISVLGLNPCITELSQRYRNSMKVTLQLDEPSSSLNPDKGLAIYRICEQTLLNAALHGKAKHCTIRTSFEGNGNTSITIDNDGILLPDGKAQSGGGTAVIDAWVSRFAGTWTLANTDEKTVRMNAQLPEKTSQ